MTFEVGQWVRVAANCDVSSLVGRVFKVAAVPGGHALLGLGSYSVPFTQAEPWMPKPGERARTNDATPGGGGVEATVLATTPPRLVEVNIPSKGFPGRWSLLDVSWLSPVLDAEGRPVVERVAETLELGGSYVANPPGGAGAKLCEAFVGGPPVLSRTPFRHDEWRSEYLGKPRPSLVPDRASVSPAAPGFVSISYRMPEVSVAEKSATYRPRLGDLVLFFGTECVVERKDLDGVIDVRGLGAGAGAQRTFPDQVEPLRPSVVGQRVRWEGSSPWAGVVEGIGSRVHVAWDEGVPLPFAPRSSEAAHDLVRIADRASSAWPALVAAVDAEIGRAVLGPLAPMPTGNAEVDDRNLAIARLAKYAVPGSVSVERSGRLWQVGYTALDGTPRAVKDGSVAGAVHALVHAAQLRAEADRKIEASRSLAIAERPWRVDDYAPPPPCGSRSHAQRPKGTTCVHFWPCGCAIEPESEEHAGTVDGAPRDVLVLGHGAEGQGWTRDEAVSAWRAHLAEVQVAFDAGNHVFRTGTRALRAERKAARDAAVQKTREQDPTTYAAQRKVGVALNGSTRQPDWSHLVEVRIGGWSVGRG